jgi:hypothetical protein
VYKESTTRLARDGINVMFDVGPVVNGHVGLGYIFLAGSADGVHFKILDHGRVVVVGGG